MVTCLIHMVGRCGFEAVGGGWMGGLLVLHDDVI